MALSFEWPLLLFGLLPFSRHRQGHRRQKLYAAFLLVLSTLGGIYGIHISFKDGLIISNFVSLLLFVSYRLAVGVCHLEVAFRQHEYTQYLQQAERLRKLFQRDFGLPLALGNCRHRHCVKYVGYAVVGFGGLLNFATLISICPYYGFFWSSLPMLIILRTRGLQAMLYIDYVCHLVRMLNAKLAALVSCKVHGDYVVLDVNYKFMESFECLKQLKSLYEEIAKYQATLNGFFGWSLLALVTIFGLDIIIYTYWTFLVMNGFYPPYYMMLTVSMTVPTVVLLTMLMFSGEQCKRQSQLTCSLAHRLLCTTANCEEYLDLAHEFSMEIMQNPIEINVKDFFAIDLKLLMQFVAAIVTYLVVLLQFSTKSTLD